jgi:hypothetical protein
MKRIVESTEEVLSACCFIGEEMSRYDFAALSSQDFEEISRDLLQAEWNVRLEAFKSGRDKGIDLRYIREGSGTTIIQCKHYLKSGFAKLLSHLRNEERPKVEQLTPTRYVVVTSVGLTPGNKDEIMGALSPFIKSASDIIGADDIEGLLSRHPNIMRANFKLWLTSTNVIERVLHNAEICQTEFEVNWIRRKLPLFVQSSAFPRAMRLLDDFRIVVISGAPGIGKTTLAEMLLYTHLDQGYEPVVIKAEIAEGKTFFRQEAKRIFYYDDFLGQIYLGDRGEYLGRNQDAALTDFMDMVRRSDHARFILTTRAHILSTALQMSERLARSPILEHRCVLELDSYTYAHRARILYNHLYFSDLPIDYKREVLKEDFFLDIIKHEHFNPRLIEWLSTDLRQREVGVRDYRAYIERLLKSPHDIWTGAFRNQISDAARHVLLSFYTLGEWTDVIDIEPAFRSLHRYRAAKYNQPIAPGDFRNALRELDGAFLSYSSGHASYLNPSLREFVAVVISEDADTAEDLLYSAIRFSQIAELRKLAVQHPDSALGRLFASISESMPSLLRPLLQGPTTRWEKSRSGGMTGHVVDMGGEARIGFLVEMSEAQHSKQLLDLASLASDHLAAGWNTVVPEFSSLIRLFSTICDSTWFVAHGGQKIYRKLLEGMLNHLTFANAADWVQIAELPKSGMEWNMDDQSKFDQGLKEYCENGIDDERSNSTGIDEMREFAISLEQLGSTLGHDFSKEIRQLEEDIAEVEEEEESESLSEGSSIPRDSMSTQRNVVTDDDVRQMFRTLV